MLRSRLSALILLLAACGEDELRLVPCEEAQPEFDIEQVSVLETAFAIKGGADAVVLDADLAKIPDGGVWSVGSVDVLIAIPQAEGDRLNTGIPLTVQVWDGVNPKQSKPFEVRQQLDPTKLEWESVQIAEHMTGRKVSVRRAWWRFDFTGAFPETGMQTKRYLVAVRWSTNERPLVGYSNYNRPCALNWTDYDDGAGWVLNAGTTGSECAWPMFRVNSRIVTKKVSCD